jgi:inhibitor of KinA
LTPTEVIRIHAATEYPVYMLGFSPGFCYLGGLDPRLTCPRRDQPRPRVPAGSVGIAGQQTGVYASATPGGWNIIGRTSITLFDPHADPAFALRAGDRVRFRAIGAAEFDARHE